MLCGRSTSAGIVRMRVTWLRARSIRSSRVPPGTAGRPNPGDPVSTAHIDPSGARWIAFSPMNGATGTPPVAAAGGSRGRPGSSPFQAADG